MIPWNAITLGAAVAWLSFAMSMVFLLLKANGHQPRQIHGIRFCFMVLFAIIGFERLHAFIELQDALNRLIATVMRESPAWLPKSDRETFETWQNLRRAGNVWAILTIPAFAWYVMWEVGVWQRERERRRSAGTIKETP